MRVIIAGSRDLDSEHTMAAISKCSFTITTVISGGARGPDTHGIIWAELNSVAHEVYKAEWDKYDKAAGHIRNKAMAQVAEALIAVWDGESPGTKNMILEARKKNLKIFVFNPHEESCITRR